MRKTFLLYLLFVSCAQPNADFLADTGALEAKIDSYVDNGSLAVVQVYLEDHEGNKLYSYSRKNDTLIKSEINENTWFRIWSMSKIITISIALDLVEEGIISMNDDISKYLPELKNLKIARGIAGEKLNQWDNKDLCPITFEEHDKKMTISDLINHKAGFYYSTTNIDCLNKLIAAQNLAASKDSDDFLRKIAQLPLIQEPGEGYYYGLNTTILGMVCEKATRKTLNALLFEKIVDPYQIKGLAYKKKAGVALLPVFSGANSLVRKASAGELDIFGQDLPQYEENDQLFLGGEGMIATSNGYADFLRIILNKGILNNMRLLEETTITEMTSPQTLTDNPYGYNGYNLWVTNNKFREEGTGDSGLWTGGGYEGTHFWIDPKRKFVGLIMTQIFMANSKASNKDNEIRGLIYNQIFNNEK